MRTLSREAVFKYTFSRLFNPSDEGLFAVLISDLNDDDKAFATELLKKIDENNEKYLEEISKLSINFKLYRLREADKCALVLGMAELDNFPNTPVPVAIDEAVKLAAKFSTEKSPDFVNGILSAYIKEKNNG